MEIDLHTANGVDSRCLEFRAGQVDHVIGFLPGSHFRTEKIVDHIIIDNECIAADHDVLLGIIFNQDLDPIAPYIIGHIFRRCNLDPVLVDQNLILNRDVSLAALFLCGACLRICAPFRGSSLLRSVLFRSSTRIPCVLFYLHNILGRGRFRRSAS